MSKPIYGIASLGNHIELYFVEPGANNGFRGWFNQDVMNSLAASSQPLVVGMEPGSIADTWAPRFRDRGHSVYVVPSAADVVHAKAADTSSAKAICQAALLMHADNAAWC